MNTQLTDICMRIVGRYIKGDIELYEDVVCEVADTIEDYMDSHPRLKEDTTDWNWEEITDQLIYDWKEENRWVGF
jgi:hypothetical protein